MATGKPGHDPSAFASLPACLLRQHQPPDDRDEPVLLPDAALIHHSQGMGHHLELADEVDCRRPLRDRGTGKPAERPGDHRAETSVGMGYVHAPAMDRRPGLYPEARTVLAAAVRLVHEEAAAYSG